MRKPSVALLISGLKGHYLLDTCARYYDVKAVAHLPIKGTLDKSNAAIPICCKKTKIEMLEREELLRAFEDVHFVFAAGWRQLIFEPPENLIVFHDSLLPQYRGYSPTVTALLSGATKIGVTAFLPVSDVDAGPIVCQAARDIDSSTYCRSAYELQKECYEDIVSKLRGKTLEELQSQARKQNELEASYSLWRDDEDYWIDWKDSAENIERKIRALSWPYLGARSTCDNLNLIIERAEIVLDVNIIDRVPGKIYRLEKGKPVVVCGTGLLKIMRALEMDSRKEHEFNHLRLRLG